jgi:sodium-dependent dicarboxylate transporter 2/3/5
VNDRSADSEGRDQPLRWWAVLLGPALFAATLLVPPPPGFESLAWPVLGLAAWMACWWALEAVPLPATALLPLAIVPLLGFEQPASILAEYANSSIFLILGGFLVALAMERCGLHRRIAFSIVARVGEEPRRLVLGVMIATALLSMWVSNTSTTLMMLPVATSIGALLALESAPGDERSVLNFRAAMTICVAYSATIGGLGTLIGTPTNALVQGFAARNLGIDLSFVDWLMFGLPTVCVLLPLAWWVLVRVALPFELQPSPASAGLVRESLRALGPMSSAERRVALVGAAAGAAWILRPLLNDLPGLGRLNDTVIAICAGLTLFVLPSGPGSRLALLDAASFRRVPWEVLLLFGGGLALAAAIQASTLSGTMGAALSALGGWPLFALVAFVVTVLIFWTELNSNVATAATFLPVLAALAAATDHDALALLVPAAMAASAAFMLPVGTPANAIVFASGQVALRQMIRAGIWVNVIAIVVITLVGYYTVGLIGPGLAID